jgi:hypothetical protein
LGKTLTDRPANKHTNLTVPQPVKQIPALYGTEGCTAAFKTVHAPIRHYKKSVYRTSKHIKHLPDGSTGVKYTEGVNVIDGKQNEIQTAHSNVFCCFECGKTFCEVETTNDVMEDF